MGWIRLDDRFLDHPKFLAAGPFAGYLHIAAIAWSNQHRTDGVIPFAQVARLVNWAGAAHTVDSDRHVRDNDVQATPVQADSLAWDLIAAGLWERHGEDFAIHDYLDWQTRSNEISALSQSRAVAGKKGAAARWQNGKLNGRPVATPSQTDGNTDGKPIARSKKEEEENTSCSKNASHSRSRSVAVTVSPDVERLCELLSTLTRQRLGLPSSSPKYAVTNDWRTSMRLLVEKDRAHVADPAAEVEAAIRWVDRDDFWSRQILSPGKLRAKYDQLVLAAKERKPRTSSTTTARDARFAEREAAAARVIAQRQHQGVPA